jgi:hypothetical protein
MSDNYPCTRNGAFHRTTIRQGGAFESSSQHMMSYQVDRCCPTISRFLRKGGIQSKPKIFGRRMRPSPPVSFRPPPERSRRQVEEPASLSITQRLRGNRGCPPFRVLCERVGGACDHLNPVSFRPPPERSRRQVEEPASLSITQRLRGNRGCPTISRSLRKGGRRMRPPQPRVIPGAPHHASSKYLTGKNHSISTTTATSNFE